MLDFSFSEEQEMFRQAVRDFSEKEVAPLVDECERTEKFPVSIYRQLGKLGYLGVNSPRELGGMGASKVMECILIEELSRICAAIGGSIGVSPFIVTPIIFDHGTDEHKRRFVVPTIQGDKIAAIAITEPNAGSDVSGIRTTAVRDGDEYVLNGSKLFISNGPIADYVLVLAYTDRSMGIKGTGLFLVERGTPGFGVRKLNKLSNRSGETGELSFDNCRIPAGNALAGEVDGFKHIMQGFNAERVGNAAYSLGIARAGYEAALQYARERVQFGRTIGSFQSIAFRLADMATSVQAAHLMLYSAAWTQDSGRPYIKEASMAKLCASEAAVRVCREAVQIHGGYGVMAEFPVARFFQDSLLGTIGGGTSEIQRLLIAKQIGLAV